MHLMQLDKSESSDTESDDESTGSESETDGDDEETGAHNSSPEDEVADSDPKQEEELDHETENCGIFYGYSSYVYFWGFLAFQ